MNTLVLTRFARTPFGVFGRYRLPGGNQQYTLEPETLHIPADVYQCKPRFYIGGDYAASMVQDVPGRTNILFHKGNTIDDTTGCILVGEGLGFVYEKWAITNSTDAFALFMREYGRAEFTLDIRESF